MAPSTCYDADLQDFHDLFRLEPRTLGRGASGIVQLARVKGHHRGEQVAVKIIADKSVDGRGSNTAQKEAMLLGAVQKHPNVVKLLGLFRFEAHEDGADDTECELSGAPENFQGLRWALALEYCAGGDLQSLVSRKGRFSEMNAAFVINGLLAAIAHLHACLIVHRDVKPGNVLFGSCGKPMLCDFGLAVSVADTTTKISWNHGTPGYLAPEVLSGTDAFCGCKIDVFSTGAVLCFAVTGRSPFHANDVVSILRNTAKCKLDFDGDDMLRTLSFNCKMFVYKLLSRNPKERPMARDCLEDAFLTQLSCSRHFISRMGDDMSYDACKIRLMDLQQRVGASRHLPPICMDGELARQCTKLSRPASAAPHVKSPNRCRRMLQAKLSRRLSQKKCSDYDIAAVDFVPVLSGAPSEADDNQRASRHPIVVPRPPPRHANMKKSFLRRFREAVLWKEKDPDPECIPSEEFLEYKACVF